MNDWVQMVREFHLKFGAPVAERPTIIPFERWTLRARLIREEAKETDEAMFMVETEGLEGVADGLADLIYVCIGAALEYGIDLDRVFREVHRTNMLKEGGGSRPDGKILKPQGWEPPRIREIIEEAMKR